MKYVGLNSKWIIVLNVKCKSIKLLEENICDIGLGKYNLKSSIHEKNNNLCFKIKKRKSRVSLFNRMRNQVTDWNICKSQSDTELVSRRCKELSKLRKTSQ